ncbi:HdeD Uncharacterized conserved protein [Flavobacteriaceae bacterium]
MTTLINQLSKTIKHWYIPMIIGILFVLFGIYIFTTPLETYVTLSVFFSFSFIVSGIFDIYFSIQNKDSLPGWGWYLVSGLLTLVIGVYLISNPLTSLTVLPFFVGFTMLFRSFQLLGYSFDLRNLKILKWGNLAIISVLGIIFAFILISNPLFAGFSIVIVTALTFLSVGISSVILSFNLKKIKDFPDKISSELKNKISAIQEEINEQTNAGK